MKYNPEIHNRRSNRLKGYDYSQPGAYFVTICVKNKMHLFGDIENGKMKLNEYGKIVEYTWHDLVNHNVNVELDAFVVMPNHIHGIIVLCDIPVGAGSEPAPTFECEPALTDKFANQINEINQNSIQKAKSRVKKTCHGFSEIVRQLKTFSSKRINELRQMKGVPVWQRNYFDRIIRRHKDLAEIREYIINNPLKWELDEYYLHQ